MKFIKRYLSLFLCVSIFLGILAPTAYAVQPENDAYEITSYDNHLIYYTENMEYECCVYINIDTGIGSFAISYADHSDYIYEYYFTVDANSINSQSSAFWDSLLMDCFAQHSVWNEIYIPDAIEIVENHESDIMRLSSDPIADAMVNWLKNHKNICSSEYTGKVIASTNKAGINFMMYEDLELHAGVSNTYIVAIAMSVASFILKIWGRPVEATLLGLLSTLIGYDTIPANSKLKAYYLTATWSRYVKRQDSVHLLNHTQRIKSFEGYRWINYNDWGVHEKSERDDYTVSASYFNNYTSQFTDAYNYYLTH